MTANERDLVLRMSDDIRSLIELAHSIHGYGSAFPGSPGSDLAVKNAQMRLTEADAYLARTVAQPR